MTTYLGDSGVLAHVVASEAPLKHFSNERLARVICTGLSFAVDGIATASEMLAQVDTSDVLLKPLAIGGGHADTSAELLKLVATG